MKTNYSDLTALQDTPESNRLMRFTGGVQTVHHQTHRALEYAQEGNWLIALEFLDIATRTISSLKRVAREVPQVVNGEK